MLAKENSCMSSSKNFGPNKGVATKITKLVLDEIHDRQNCTATNNQAGGGNIM